MRIAWLFLASEDASLVVLLRLVDEFTSGALQAAQATNPDLEVMTRERMAATLGDVALLSRQANEVCADSSASV